MMNQRMTMTDHVRELCSTTVHREHYEYDLQHASGSITRYGADHVTTNPPLIEQLWGSNANQAGEDAGGLGAAHPSSRPAANLDAIDAAARIDGASATWIVELGGKDPGDTIDRVLAVHGLAAGVERCGRRAGRAGDNCCTYHQIEVDVRSWWVQARVLTGWDSAAWKPDATCPLCAERRTVSIRWSSGLATCTSCHECWDGDNIGILAEHIRAEAEAARFLPSPAPDPCRCEWPQDLQVGRIMQCPDCGSRYCVKVQDMVVPSLARHRWAG